MANIWFISDTHFNHVNMVTMFKREDGSPARPFKTVEEMNETMIKNWNDRVRDSDHIWHLGDVVMGPRQEARHILSRLKGKKRFLLGNHDQIKGTDILDFFGKLALWRIFKDEGFICTHLPLHRSQFKGMGYNVHGHMHHHTINDPAYINICVEQTNYAPLHMDELLTIIKARGG